MPSETKYLSYITKNNKMHISKLIYYFFLFLISATCFEPVVSSSGRRLYLQLRCGTFYMHQYKKSSHTDASTTYHTIIVYTWSVPKVSSHI